MQFILAKKEVSHPCICVTLFRIFVDISIFDMKTEKSTEEQCFELLERTVRRYKKFIQGEFSKRGIELSSEQWAVIQQVYEKPGISQTEIAESIYKDPASITRMIDLLEKKELLVRGSIKDDRRAFSISLTNEGLKYVEEILPLTFEMRKFGMRSLSATELAAFLKVLNRIYDNLE